MRPYGGEDGSARVARRRAALINAVFELMDRDEAIGVRSASRVAGLTTRYFYESFADSDDLMIAAFDSVIAEIRMLTRAAIASVDDPREKARLGVRSVLAVVDSDRRKGKLLFSAAPGLPALAQKRADTVKMFADLTMASSADYVPPGPERVVLAHFQVGGFIQVMRAWIAGQIDLELPVLVNTCTDLLTAPLRRS